MPSVGLRAGPGIHRLNRPALGSSRSSYAGPLIGAEHLLVRPEWSALPLAAVQVERRTRPLQKVWITRRDPGSIPPGRQGRQGGDQEFLARLVVLSA